MDQGKAYGIIPRRHDTDHAEWLVDDAVRAGKEGHRHAARFRAHPSRDIAQKIVDAADGRSDVEQQRFLARAMAEIGVERGDERFLAGKDGLLELQ